LPVQLAYIAHRRIGAFEPYHPNNRIGVGFDADTGYITIAFARVHETPVGWALSPQWLGGWNDFDHDKPMVAATRFDSPSEFENAIYQAINVHRASQGQSALIWNEALSDASRWRTQNNALFEGLPNDHNSVTLDISHVFFSYEWVMSQVIELMNQRADGPGFVGIAYNPSYGVINIAFATAFNAPMEGRPTAVSGRSFPDWMNERLFETHPIYLNAEAFGTWFQQHFNDLMNQRYNLN